MILDLFNPFRVIAILKEQKEVPLLFFMMAPFLDALIYNRFSVVLGAISTYAFFGIVNCIIGYRSDPETDDVDTR